MPLVLTIAGVVLGVIAACVVGWLVVLLSVLRVTGARAVGPAPATPDLGPEAPGIVALLAGRCRVDASAAATATLLDLVARGLVTVEQHGTDPRQMTVRVGPGRRARGLAPYERRVLNRVTEVAGGGTAPLSALAFADAGHAARWADELRNEIHAAGRAAGLIGPRLRRVHKGVVLAAALLAATVAALYVLIDETLNDATSVDPGQAAISVLLYGVFGMGYSAFANWGERETPVGRGVTARWLGVRNWLRAHESFAEQPPAAARIWGRYLAYGVALGAAPVAEGMVDFGRVRRDLLWSTAGGQWRRIRVRYPYDETHYGANLRRLLFNSAFDLFLGFIGLSLIFYLSAFAIVLTVGTGWPVFWLALPIDAAIVFCLLRATLRWPYRLVRTAFDRGPVRVEGVVLRCDVWQEALDLGRGEMSRALYHLVLDDGRSDELTAWIVPEPLAAACQVDRLIAIDVRPWSRRVVAVKGRARPVETAGRSAASRQ